MLEGCPNPECTCNGGSNDEAGQKDYIEVRIADTGQGIPKRICPDCLSRFTPPKANTGPGLDLRYMENNR